MGSLAPPPHAGCLAPRALPLGHHPLAQILPGSATRQETVALGFLGLGWIGLARMKQLAEDPRVEVVAIADPSPEARRRAAQIAPAAVVVERGEDLLEEPIDGLVIATPSGQHAEQTCQALLRGVPVFCQKPLARTTCETHRVINLAREQNLLLGVDYCYRHLAGMDQLRRCVRSGELGELFAIELAFHNAYGPDKSWASDLRQSGGGCVIDLATHLIDLALWASGDRPATRLTSRLYRQGRLLEPSCQEVEDAAFAEWLFADGVHARLACSWGASRGTAAVIEATFLCSEGTAVVRNHEGSFYDFVVEVYRGTERQQLAAPPDDWGGRAVAQWAHRLGNDRSFDPDVERCFLVADLIDSIYGR